VYDDLLRGAAGVQQWGKVLSLGAMAALLLLAYASLFVAQQPKVTSEAERITAEEH
jgi:hypothetical protein